jgi:HEAT repeat protein
LREIASRDTEKPRIAAACSLAKACRDASPNIVSLLVKGISNSDKELAWQCAFALHFVGTNAAAVLPALTNAVFTVDLATADELLQMLASLGDPSFSTLQTCAASTNADMRVVTMNSFGDFVSLTRTNLHQTVTILSEALKDPDPHVRGAAANALRRAVIERKDPKLRPVVADKLRPLLEDQEKWVRDDVKHALREIESTDEK